MRQTNVRGSLSLRGFRKLRTGAIVATGVILLGLSFLAPTVSASEQDGVWVARTVEEVKADIQNIDNLSHYTIKWGDTLSAISGATGLSVDSLVEINRIANRDLIFANNKLYFSEEAFLKDGNTEVKRQRVSIENSGSRQSYEVETKTDTVTGEQRTTVKQTTPVAVETPAVSAPKSEASVTVAPKSETRSETLHAPSVDTTNESGNSTESSPVTDKAPSNIGTTNQPVVSNPSSEAPAPQSEEPMVSEPKAEEPVSPAPQVEEPTVSEPKAEEPATSAPQADEPVSPEPKVEAPAPKVEAPAAPAPKSEEPMVSEPKAEEPVSPAPQVEEPTVSEPKAEEPATPAPKADEPMVSEPKAEEPATPAPKTDEPVSPAPKVEEPVSPAPQVEEPTVSEPKAEAPVATRPTTEEPVTPKGEVPAVPQKEVQTVFKSEVSQASAGNVLVGIKGEFLTPDQQAILDSLNKIRKEAFEEKLVDKYVPIKWSTQLEKTALMRAAESSITNAHARLSDKDIWTAFPTGTRTFGENLAWNYKGFAEAIEQWYSEKADYIKESKGETVAGQTGHYKSLINPLYTYTGLGAFNNPRHEYHRITVAQILGDKVDSEALVGQYGPAIQEAEVTESQLSSFKTKADIVENISEEETNSKDVNSQEATSETRDVTSHGNGATEEAKTAESTESTEKSQVEPVDKAETGKTSVAPSSDSEEVSTATEETGEATSSDSNLVNSQENNSETQDGTTNATSEESSESASEETPVPSAEPTESSPVVEGQTSGEKGQSVEESSATPESESSATQPSMEAGTSATTETATPAPADSTNEATNEGESENAVAEETPVTEEQPATDTDSSAETSNSADSSPSTGSTATEGPTDTTGNTSNNSSTDFTPSSDETTEQSGSSVPEAEEASPEVVKPADPKAEESTATTPKAEAPTESTETKESVESTPEGTVESESAPKEIGEGEKPAPKEAETEGKVSEASGTTEGTPTESSEAKVTEPAAESTVTEGTTPEVKTTGDEEKDSKVEDTDKEANSTEGTVDSTSVPKEVGTEGNNEETNSQNAEASTGDGNSESTTSTSDKAKREEVVNGTEETDGANVESEQKAETPKVEESEATTSGNQGQPVEESSETKEAESTPVTDNVPSNNSLTDATTDGNSNDSTSNEENSQDDEPAVEHQDSEKSLEEDTKNSNKAAIDDHKKLAEEAISTSDLDDTQKQEARDRLNELTNLYYKKLEEEKDFEKQTQLVDEYETLSQSIQTPGATIEGAADYTKPIESHAGGTTIDENSTVANSALTSSNPSSQPSSSEDSPQAQPAATSDSSTTGDSGFRSAGTYQPRVTRRRRSIEEPQNTVSIYYNFDGMKDIPGFFGDPGEKNDIEIPKDASGEKVKSLIKEKIDAKKSELAKRGYQFSEDIFVEYTHQDATHYDYVVTFTKQATGTTGFRIAPKVQVRAKKVVKRDLSNKTKYINVYYNLTSLKDIAGALGELGGENVLTFSGETSKEELKRVVEEKTKAQIEKLKKQGFTVTSKTDLDQIIEGGDSYDYVVEFTKEAKTQPVGTTGFRKASLVQRRAKRSTEAKETVNVNIYFNLKTLPGIAGALDVDGETTIKLPKNASEEEVKEAIKAKIAKVENRGYKVNDFYFGAKTEKGYDYVVEFTK